MGGTVNNFAGSYSASSTRAGWTAGELWARHNKLVEENHRRKTTTNECELRQWIGELRANGYQPGDLVLTDISTEVFLYLGRTDFWLRSRGFEKYTYAPDGVRRDIHTGAPLVTSVAEFERLVRAPNAGRIAWVVGSNRRWQWQSATDRDLREYFEERAVLRLQPRDNTRLYKLNL